MTQSDIKTNTATFTSRTALSLAQSTMKYPVCLQDAWIWLGYPSKRVAKEYFLNFGWFMEERDYKHLVTVRHFKFFYWDLFLTLDALKNWSFLANNSCAEVVKKHLLELHKDI